MSRTMLQVSLLVELLKGVFVEQDSEVRVTSMRNKLIGGVRDMITGFLKDNCMEPSTGRRKNLGGVPAEDA